MATEYGVKLYSVAILILGALLLKKAEYNINMWWIPVVIWFIVLSIIWFSFWIALSHQWYYLDVEEAKVKDLPIPNKTWRVKLGDIAFGWLIERQRR